MKRIILLVSLLIPFTVNAADVCVSIKDENLTVQKNNIAAGWGYQETIPNPEGSTPNPESKIDFIKRNIVLKLNEAGERGAALTEAKEAYNTVLENYKTTYGNDITPKK